MPATCLRARLCRSRFQSKIDGKGAASARVTLVPAFCHHRQDRHTIRGSSDRFGSSPVEESELGVEANIQARGNFEGRILEDVRAASATPCHHGVVAHPQQCCDLRAEESKHSADPPVERLRRLDLGDAAW